MVDFKAGKIFIILIYYSCSSQPIQPQAHMPTSLFYRVKLAKKRKNMAICTKSIQYFISTQKTTLSKNFHSKFQFQVLARYNFKCFTLHCIICLNCQTVKHTCVYFVDSRYMKFDTYDNSYVFTIQSSNIGLVYFV